MLIFRGWGPLMSRTGCKYCYSLVCCRCNGKHRAASAHAAPPAYSGMSLAALPNSNQAAPGSNGNSAGQAIGAGNGASLSADHVAAEAVSTSQLMTNNVREHTSNPN